MKFYYICLSLYNKKELISQLSHVQKDDSDEVVLRRGYEAWGVKLFEKLNADFALAFYDEKKEVLYAGRDPMGVKALYYAVHEGEYVFSDSIDILFSLSGMKKQVNREAMYTLLKHIAVDYESTMYEGIHRVPPGHYLEVKDNEIRLVRYWFPERIETDYRVSLEEAAERFREIFEKAIVSRVCKDEETAYELSGGLDSSSVVSLLKKRDKHKKIDTYAMSFTGLSCDESDYIRSVEEKYSFSVTKVASENLAYESQFDFQFNYEMNPHWPITTTFTMMFPMVQKMHEDGKKIILTGQGGDHLLTGHCMVLGDLLKRRAFAKVWKELYFHIYGLKEILGCALLPLLGQKMKHVLHTVYRVIKKKRSKESLFSDLFQTASLTSDLKKYTINVLVSASQSTMMDGNAFHALEKRYNVEFRHPFYDKDLVEYVLSLPPEYLYSQGWIKMLLRYAMEGILPDKIQSRRDKADFFEVLIQQLNAIDFKTVLENANLVSLGLIKQKEIDRLIAQFEDGNNSTLLQLWTVINVAYWYGEVQHQK